MRKLLTLVMAAAAILPGLARAQGAPPRSEVPIKEVILSDGTRRYAVTIQVGGTTIEAGLDSGSTGLRILPGVLAPGDAERTGRGSRYGYGAGAELRGVIGRATVRIGGQGGPTTVQLVESVGCTAQRPDCAAGRIALADYGIQGDGLKGEGFKAILGANMGEADAASPLPAIGARRWIIELPLPGSGRPGRLILDPAPEEMAGYRTLHVLAGPGGMHDAVRGCLENAASKQALCGPAILDTGAPGIEAINADGAAWPAGTPAVLAFFDRGDKPVTAASFQIGQRKFASHLAFPHRPLAGQLRLFTGLAAYFAYSVLYDSEAGTLGLKPRPDTEMAVQ